MIKQAAFHTHGAADVSGVDAFGWQHLYSSFGDASVSLCNALASVDHYLSTFEVHPAILAPLVACRLIPLNKNSELCPIEIGDVPQEFLQKLPLGSILSPNPLHYLCQ